MNLIVRKCDRGVPLPEGSTGTWFTWDTWDVEVGRSISRHREEDEAREAAVLLTREPRFRDLLEHIVNRTGPARPGPIDTIILEALVAASKIQPSDT